MQPAARRLGLGRQPASHRLVAGYCCGILKGGGLEDKGRSCDSLPMKGVSCHSFVVENNRNSIVAGW
ncbi:hypothetical protein NDU88_000400 [Pleurodeles waltl]|uniref:Uncharacterized protein n=1 Tax=Pleurodeles waltl TaxID=8319 RepID=A0AAV7KXS2_PLEWA|nr:hypothetical protein NDU88_000400 [Pleurodeles waltl]